MEKQNKIGSFVTNDVFQPLLRPCGIEILDKKA